MRSEGAIVHSTVYTVPLQESFREEDTKSPQQQGFHRRMQHYTAPSHSLRKRKD